MKAHKHLHSFHMHSLFCPPINGKLFVTKELVYNKCFTIINKYLSCISFGAYVPGISHVSWVEKGYEWELFE